MYGDGVNIAARLESLAQPGGVTVSDTVRTSLRGRVVATFEDLGERTVKNIPEPVRAYAVRAGAAAAVTATAAPAGARPGMTRRRVAVMAGSVLVVALIGAGTWYAAGRSRVVEPTPVPAAHGAALPLPSKPSIAVLPFDNLGGEAEQAYFADGITKVSGLFVIARWASATCSRAAYGAAAATFASTRSSSTPSAAVTCGRIATTAT